MLVRKLTQQQGQDHAIYQQDSMNVTNTKWENVNSQQCPVTGQETMDTD